MISRDSAAGARPHGCGVTGETIGERLARDRQALLPLPPAPYGACDKRPGRVSSLSLLRCRGNDLLRTRGLRPPRGTDPGLCRRGDDQLRGRGDRPAPPVHLAQPDPQPHGRRPRPRQTPKIRGTVQRSVGHGFDLVRPGIEKIAASWADKPAASLGDYCSAVLSRDRRSPRAPCPSPWRARTCG